MHFFSHSFRWFATNRSTVSTVVTGLPEHVRARMREGNKERERVRECESERERESTRACTFVIGLDVDLGAAAHLFALDNEFLSAVFFGSHQHIDAAQ